MVKVVKSGDVLKRESVSRLCCSALFSYFAWLRNVTACSQAPDDGVRSYLRFLCFEYYSC